MNLQAPHPALSLVDGNDRKIAPKEYALLERIWFGQSLDMGKHLYSTWFLVIWPCPIAQLLGVSLVLKGPTSSSRSFSLRSKGSSIGPADGHWAMEGEFEEMLKDLVPQVGPMVWSC